MIMGLVVLAAAQMIPPVGMAVAQNARRGYVQITTVGASTTHLLLDHNRPDACGTTTVQVFVLRSELASDPTVTISISEYSSRPPGVIIGVIPEKQSNKITYPSTLTTFTFRVCATGTVTGTATLIAIVDSVGPGPEYDIHEPDPDESGRGTFTVAQ